MTPAQHPIDTGLRGCALKRVPPQERRGAVHSVHPCWLSGCVTRAPYAVAPWPRTLVGDGKCRLGGDSPKRGGIGVAWLTMAHNGAHNTISAARFTPARGTWRSGAGRTALGAHGLDRRAMGRAPDILCILSIDVGPGKGLRGSCLRRNDGGGAGMTRRLESRA